MAAPLGIILDPTFIAVSRKLKFSPDVRNVMQRKHCKVMDKEHLVDKFKGCLVGALIGDCLGEPFEQDDWDELPNESQLDDYVQELVASKVKVPYKQYTDDTAMTRCVASSFINQQAFDAKDMAKRFAKEFFAEPRRGYGASVPVVFGALRKNDFEQPFLPAREQFNGMGSFGNGGAMRVAPVALFCYNSQEALIDTARQTARITHAHREGYNGAILQCLAVRQALQADPARPLNGADFLDRLRTHMEQLETCQQGEIVDAGRPVAPYQQQLAAAEELLSRSPPPGRHSVVDLLGHDISALHSVPTALYCFLRALQPLPGIQTESGVVRAIQYAISLGGDTDTIASMAGAIAGAYHGLAAVPPALLTYCEKADEAVTMAAELWELAQP